MGRDELMAHVTRRVIMSSCGCADVHTLWHGFAAYDLAREAAGVSRD